MEKDALVGPLKAAGSSYTFVHQRREVQVCCAAWRPQVSTGIFGLPDEHSLERVLLGAILAADEPKVLLDWMEQSTKSLRLLVSDHGWKRAFRIAGAAIAPDAEAFVDALMQRGTTAPLCMAAVRASKAGSAVVEFLGGPETPA